MEFRHTSPQLLTPFSSIGEFDIDLEKSAWLRTARSRNSIAGKKTSKLNSVLGIYMFSRYFGLIVQSVNLFLVFRLSMRQEIARTSCQGWNGFLLTSSSILLVTLDYIVMLRVYALYKKDTKIGLLVVSLFLLMVGATLYAAWKVVFYAPYDSMCVQRPMHPCVPFYGIVVWSTQLTLGILTALKWRVLSLGAPITDVVGRDGGCVLGIISAIFAVHMRHTMSLQAIHPEQAFMMPISFFSITCCRIIMNMQTLDIGHQSFDIDNNAAILTSAIDLLSLERNSEILDAEQTTPSQHALSFEHDA
ncbi:hypothetical protein CPC08DRAFT_709213 [Agrocybe pediades]|nr:hypothetical protein CPC08DRAFT_709213 [Agrocybe pediades]